MKYPAFVYELDDIESEFANGGVYLFAKSYSLTVIDPNPDNLLVDKIVTSFNCEFDRHYQKNNLNHYVFSLFF